MSKAAKDVAVTPEVVITVKNPLAPIAAETKLQPELAVKPEQKIEQDSLFKGLIQLQSAHSSTVHTIKNYQIIENEEDDICILEVDKEELLASRQASIKAEQDYLKKYAAKEFLAHELAYKIPSSLVNGDKVAVLEEDGSKSEYECHRLAADNKGIVGYVLLPTKANAQGRYDIKVVFRGTNPKDIHPIMRNLLEPKGAGSVSFEANSCLLLSQVNQHIKAFSEKHAIAATGLDLGVYGHSLGGADAQNYFTKTLLAIAEQNGATNTTILPKECIDHFHHIRKLHLNTANSAGVPKETALLAEELVKKLAKKRADGETAFECPESYNIRKGGDGVQATGEAHVLSNVSANEAKVDVLKAHVGAEYHNRLTVPRVAALIGVGFAGNIVTAGLATAAVVGSAIAGLYDTNVSHTAKLFDKPREATFQMMSNATVCGQAEVAKQLNNKSWWLGAIHSGAIAIADGFSTVQSAFMGTAKSPKASEGNSGSEMPGHPITAEAKAAALLFSQEASHAATAMVSANKSTLRTIPTTASSLAMAMPEMNDLQMPLAERARAIQV